MLGIYSFKCYSSSRITLYDHLWDKFCYLMIDRVLHSIFLPSTRPKGQMISKCFALEDFDHRNLVFMKNKSDIRHQHQKLHRIANFFYPKKFTSKFNRNLILRHFLLVSARSVLQVELWSKRFLDKKLVIWCSFWCWCRISDLFFMKIRFR